MTIDMPKPVSNAYIKSDNAAPNPVTKPDHRPLFTIYRIGFQNSALVVVRNEKPQIPIRIISVMPQRQIDIIPVHGIGNFRCKALYVPFEPAVFRKGIKLVIHIGSPAGDRASQ